MISLSKSNVLTTFYSSSSERDYHNENVHVPCFSIGLRWNYHPCHIINRKRFDNCCDTVKRSQVIKAFTYVSIVLVPFNPLIFESCIVKASCKGNFIRGKGGIGENSFVFCVTCNQHITIFVIVKVEDLQFITFRPNSYRPFFVLIARLWIKNWKNSKN